MMLMQSRVTLQDSQVEQAVQASNLHIYIILPALSTLQNAIGLGRLYGTRQSTAQFGLDGDQPKQEMSLKTPTSHFENERYRTCTI